MKTFVPQLIDDLDGGKAHHEIRFALDGQEYEIDLSDRNRKAFLKVLDPYVQHARPVKPAKRAAVKRIPQRQGRRSASVDVAAVREWATAQGMTVSNRGRVAKAVLDAYNAAH